MVVYQNSQVSGMYLPTLFHWSSDCLADSPPPRSANSTYHIIGRPYTLAHVMLPLLSIFLLTHARTFAYTRTVS